MFGLSVSLVVLLCFVRESQDLSTRIEAEVDSQDGLWFFGLKPFSIFVLFCCACSLELYRLESSIFPGTYSNHWFGLHRTFSNFLGICRSGWGGSIVVEIRKKLRSDVPSGFYWPGLADWSSFLALDEAMAFWDLVWKPQKLLVRVLGSKPGVTYLQMEGSVGMEGSISSFSFIPDCIAVHPFVVRWGVFCWSCSRLRWKKGGAKYRMKRSRGKVIKDWHMRFGRTKLGRREE